MSTSDITEAPKSRRGRKPLPDGMKKKTNQMNVRWDDREYTALLEAAGSLEKVPELVRLGVKDLIKKQVRVKIKGEWVYMPLAEARMLMKDLMEQVF